jgi:hypothetical protein
MAAKVGTGVYGGSNPGSTVASAAKATTTGNFLVACIKTEQGTNVTGVADTAGNNWQIVVNLDYATGNGNICLAYAANITGHGSNVVTATFAASSVWNVILVDEFSGLATSAVTDGSYQSAGGTGTSYTTSNITTSDSGLVVMVVGGYGGLTSKTGTAGNPDFSVGADNGTSDASAGLYYLISGSGQTVTPGGGSSYSDAWGAIAQAFLDAPDSTANRGAAPQVQIFQPIIVGFAR